MIGKAGRSHGPGCRFWHELGLGVSLPFQYGFHRQQAAGTTVASHFNTHTHTAHLLPSLDEIWNDRSITLACRGRVTSNRRAQVTTEEFGLLRTDPGIAGARVIR